MRCRRRGDGHRHPDDTGVGWPDTAPDRAGPNVDSTTATYTVTFADVACTPVAPADPAVTQATCINGEVTVPTSCWRPTPPGVTYVADPPGPYDPTAPTTGDGDGDAGRRPEVGHDATDVDVRRPDDGDVHGDVERGVMYGVTPVAPTVTEAVCRNGVLQPPTLTPADDRRDHLHGRSRSAVRGRATW